MNHFSREEKPNPIHVVFGNESLLSAGGFPTATVTGSVIAGMAVAAGIPRTACHQAILAEK